MMNNEAPEQGQDRGQWASRLGFILAASGSAVGLGNIWKFPYITGENGGGLFVLIYLLCIALVGIPIMAAEIMIGRAAQAQPAVAFSKLKGGRTGWSFVGWLGVIAGFIILSYYIVVAGWSLDYTLKSFTNFTAPIAEKADVGARAYRAAHDIKTHRAALTDYHTTKNYKGLQRDICAQSSRSTWKRHETYRRLITIAKGTEERDAVNAMVPLCPDTAPKGFSVKEAEFKALVASGQDATRSRLLENPETKAAVDAIEPLSQQLDDAMARAQREASTTVAALSDSEVRDITEENMRRDLVAGEVGAAFNAVISDGWTGTFWALLFILLTILIVVGGVSGGIERAARILMPTLIGLMVVMVVYGATQSGFAEALAFVFEPDPSRLKASGVLEALGHAFFTLSLGMGCMITYGSYQRSKGQLFRQSVWIAGLDTGVALIACMMLFPILFSFGQEASSGPGLVFVSMPLAFAEMGALGMLLSIVFFGLLAMAALTSAVSLLEVVASYFIDKRGWSRSRAAWTFGGVIFLFGVPSAFSFDPDFALSSWTPTFGHSFFETMDYLASNWLLPLGGLFIAVYAGWFMPKRLRDAELTGSSAAIISAWLVAIRYVAPILVTLVLLQKVGLIALT